MKFIIEKRNYIILITIIIIILGLVFLNFDNKPDVKTFDFENKKITIIVYDKIDKNKVHSKINKILNYYTNYDKKLNKELNTNMKSFLEYGKIVYYKTDGYVDITSGDLLDNLKNNKEYNFVSNINNIIVDKNNLKTKINFNIENVISNYVVSDIVDYFRDQKIEKYIINENGNIAAGSKYDTSKYTISINDSSNKILQVVYLEKESLVTLKKSNKVESYNINPKTSKKEDLYDFVSVISKDNLTANMVASTLYFLNIEDGKKFAEKYNCAALWYTDGNIITTDNFSKYTK